MYVCLPCRQRFQTLLNRDDPLDASPPEAGQVCQACLGVLEHMSAHIESLVAALKASPFLDSEEIAVHTTIPRHVAMLGLGAYLRIADGQSDEPVPLDDLVHGFRERTVNELRNAFMLHPYVCGERKLRYSGINPIGIIVEPTFEHPESENVFEDLTTFFASSCGHNQQGALREKVGRMKHEKVGTKREREQLSASTVGGTIGPTSGDLSHKRLIEDTALVNHLTPPKSKTWSAVSLTVSVRHEPLFLFGKYIKESRGLSQSPWFLDGRRVGSSGSSLQEAIADPIIQLFFPAEDLQQLYPTASIVTEREQKCDRSQAKKELKEQRLSVGHHPESVPNEHPELYQKLVFAHDKYKFHAAGREDVDVRMLGQGRPFVLEILNPHRQFFSDEDLRAMESMVNEKCSDVAAVGISQLRVADRNIMQEMVRLSEEKKKQYRCVVWCERKMGSLHEDEGLQALSALKDLKIDQKTPVRVLHRRSALTRVRLIHSARIVERVNDHWLVLDLETQAGTYVKEFCHGDFGRTTPNLGTILRGKTDIVQLDVADLVLQDN